VREVTTCADTSTVQAAPEINERSEIVIIIDAEFWRRIATFSAPATPYVPLDAASRA
jgi:hypothetical protein